MTKGASALSQAMLQTVTWGGHSGTARRYLLWQLRLLPQPPIWSAHPIQLVAISPGPPSSSFSSLHCHLPPHSPAVTLQKSCQALNNSLNRTGWWTALDFGFQLVAPRSSQAPPATLVLILQLSNTHTQWLIHTFILVRTTRAHIQSDTSPRNCSFPNMNSHRSDSAALRNVHEWRG